MIGKLRSGPGRQPDNILDSIWALLLSLNKPNRIINIQWIPSHKGIEYNDVADSLAAEGSNMTQQEVPVSFETAKACIRRHLYKDHEANVNRQLEDHYKESTKGKPKSIAHMSRKDQITIHQLRLGSTPLVRNNLAVYKNLDDKEKLCPNGCNVKETVKHLFTCPLYSGLRQRVFGDTDVSLKVLNDKPEDVMEYLSMMGRTSAPPTGGVQ